MVDTFGSGSGFSGGPSISPGPMNLSIPYLAPAQPDPDEMARKVERDIENYRASLPNDKHVLIGKLKGLIQKRLNEWGQVWDPWDEDRWDGYCGAVLDKLPQDNCQDAWNDVCLTASSDYWNGDPDTKRQVLEKWAEAEKICNGDDDGKPAKAPSFQNGRDHANSQMPPIAPSRLKQQLSSEKTYKLSGSDIARHALELGEQSPQRWLNDQKRKLYKCNWFVDAALRESGVILPWGANQIPLVKDMHRKLGEDSKHFVKVWPDDRSKFSEKNFQAGDIVFWDKDPQWQHSAILDGRGNMLYAGSIETNGFAKTIFNEFIKSLYGRPTAIFRYGALRN